MAVMELVQTYFDAWNARDSEALVAAFAEGGTYQDPASGGVLTGEAIGAYAEGLWVMFPDLSFEVVSAVEAGPGRVAAQWRMLGTNTGPLTPLLPPLGLPVDLPGADFIEAGTDGVHSVVGYFDQKTLLEQLGLAVMPMPAQPLGLFSFGTASYLRTDRPVRPGAISVTVLNVRNEAERQEGLARAQQVSFDLMGMDGVIGFLGLDLGNRLFTVTAWDDPQGPAQVMKSGNHTEAVKRFFEDDYSAGGMLSVWQPTWIRMLKRCPECGVMVEATRTDACPDGHALPEMSYF